MSDITYSLKNPDANLVISNAVSYLVKALKQSEEKIRQRVQKVSSDFSVGDKGERYRLSIERLPDDPVLEEVLVKEASGGVRSGSSFTSPGASPAATRTKKVNVSSRKKGPQQ